MEKIVVVKPEPPEDASKAVKSTPGQTAQKISLPAAAATLKSPVILVQSKNEGTQRIQPTTQQPKQQQLVPQQQTQVQQPQKQLQQGIPPQKQQQQQGRQQSIVVSSGPTIQAVSPLRGVSTIGQSTPVVLCRSPLKLTPVQAHRLVSSATGNKTQEQGKAANSTNFTVYHVQPLTTTTPKNPLAPKPGASPSKVVPIQLQKLIPISSSAVAKAPVTIAAQPTVLAASQQSSTTVRHIAPKVSITPVIAGQPVSIATTRLQNVTAGQQLAPKPTPPQGVTAQIQPQRVLVPAITSNMPQLQGATSNLQFPHGLISGGVVYLPQQAVNSGAFPIAVPLQTSSIGTSANQAPAPVNGTSVETSPPARPRKPCNCTKSQCLKLYCDCFANGEFCSNCNCVTCFNNMDHERERSKAIKACLERNPQAFHPKIGKGKAGESERRHNKGCHCKRSGCLKNYCECYEAKILCTSLCKCTGCKNFEESPERKTLMHLADAAEVRVKQQNAAKTILESQIEDLPTRPMLNSGERLPFSFVTEDIVQATCQCLLAQAVEAEKAGKTPVMAEKMLLEEFGRCLLRIIHTANKTKGE